ncbi:MAG: hypothetical protein ACLQVI_07905 [Polyangiaceae bacterium]
MKIDVDPRGGSSEVDPDEVGVVLLIYEWAPEGRRVVATGGGGVPGETPRSRHT